MIPSLALLGSKHQLSNLFLPYLSIGQYRLLHTGKEITGRHFLTLEAPVRYGVSVATVKRNLTKTSDICINPCSPDIHAYDKREREREREREKKKSGQVCKGGNHCDELVRYFHIALPSALLSGWPDFRRPVSFGRRFCLRHGLVTGSGAAMTSSCDRSVNLIPVNLKRGTRPNQNPTDRVP